MILNHLFRVIPIYQPQLSAQYVLFFIHLESRRVEIAGITVHGAASTLCNEAQAPTPEIAVTPPSIRKSAPTTYAESSDAR